MNLYDNYQIDLTKILKKYLSNTNYNYTYRKQISHVLDNNLDKVKSNDLKKKIGII